jgi:hypothetical protein
VKLVVLEGKSTSVRAMKLGTLAIPFVEACR